MIEQLTKIRNNFPRLSLGAALSSLLSLARERNLAVSVNKLEAIGETYGYMKQFMLAGAEDEHRESLYRELRLRTYDISTSMLLTHLFRTNRSLASAWEIVGSNPVDFSDMEHTLGWFVQELSIAQLDGGEKRRRVATEQLYAYRQRYFLSLYVAEPFSAAEEDAIVGTVLSPMTDAADIRLVVSGLMLSLQTAFDARKFRALARICRDTDTPSVRQQALAAMMFSRPSEVEAEVFGREIEESFRLLSGMPDIEQELTELQLQVLLCVDTKKTEKAIADDIMPTLRSHAMNMDSPKRREQDILDELLHPDRDEKAMEEMERCMEKMRNMMMSGADVFFGGFSQTKRFPFFYRLENWFMPFSIDHPQLAAYNFGGLDRDAISRLMEAQCFCDSDQYSFCIALSSVVNRLPKEILEMLEKSEMPPTPFEMEISKTALERRMFLQDLYRFCMLHPAKEDFRNVFADEQTAVFFNWKPVLELFSGSARPLQVARQLLKRKCFGPLNALLDNIHDELNITFLKTKALSEYGQGHPEEALKWFEKARVFDPENRLLLRRMVQAAESGGFHARAKQLYDELLLLPEDDSSRADIYGQALCLLHLRHTDEAMRLLFRLYFEDEGNAEYKSALAWGHIQNGKPKEALDMYGLMSEEEIGTADIIRKALLLWTLGEHHEAVTTLRLAANGRGPSARLLARLQEENDTCRLGIGQTELHIMSDSIGN